MKKNLWLTVTAGTALVLASLSTPAAAGGNLSFGVFVGSPGYGVYMPPPPVIYAPAPVYYAPPPRVVYAPQPYYVAPPAHYHPGRHKGWNKHRHH